MRTSRSAMLCGSVLATPVAAQPRSFLQCPGSRRRMRACTTRRALRRRTGPSSLLSSSGTACVKRPRAASMRMAAWYIEPSRSTSSVVASEAAACAVLTRSGGMLQALHDELHRSPHSCEAAVGADVETEHAGALGEAALEHRPEGLGGVAQRLLARRDADAVARLDEDVGLEPEPVDARDAPSGPGGARCPAPRAPCGAGSARTGPCCPRRRRARGTRSGEPRHQLVTRLLVAEGGRRLRPIDQILDERAVDRLVRSRK